MRPPLHYPRLEFTQDVYDAMASGFDPHRSLFGPRRIGKTSFLLHDLGPKAEQFGHRVAYVDYWSRGAAPLALTLFELDNTLKRKQGVARVTAAARDLAPRVRLSALGVDVDLDLTGRPDSLPEDQILLLGQYFDRLAALDRPVFLFFDEFQEITRSSDADTFMAALRAALNRHQGRFATVFTGSSQGRLKRVFSKRQAPFFRFATELALPPLGEAFVAHQLGFYPKSGPAVTKAEAWEVFQRLGRNPDYFQRWMRQRAVTPGLSGAEIATQVEDDIAETLEFDAIWLELTDTHRLVLRLVADGVSGLFGAEGRAAMQALGLDEPPKPSALQTAFKTLRRRDLVDDWDKERMVTDPLFQSWILDRPATDFSGP